MVSQLSSIFLLQLSPCYTYTKGVYDTSQTILQLPYVAILLNDLRRSFPSKVNPQRFGAGPAMYAQARSSVSFKNTCQAANK